MPWLLFIILLQFKMWWRKDTTIWTKAMRFMVRGTLNRIYAFTNLCACILACPCVYQNTEDKYCKDEILHAEYPEQWCSEYGEVHCSCWETGPFLLATRKNSHLLLFKGFKTATRKWQMMDSRVLNIFLTMINRGNRSSCWTLNITSNGISFWILGRYQPIHNVNYFLNSVGI